VYDTDDAPLIVFINARSGGRVGPELAGVLARALGRSQVGLAAIQMCFGCGRTAYCCNCIYCQLISRW
jgi:hypothetical protein